MDGGERRRLVSLDVRPQAPAREGGRHRRQVVREGSRIDDEGGGPELGHVHRRSVRVAGRAGTGATGVHGRRSKPGRDAIDWTLLEAVIAENKDLYGQLKYKAA